MKLMVKRYTSVGQENTAITGASFRQIAAKCSSVQFYYLVVLLMTVSGCYFAYRRKIKEPALFWLIIGAMFLAYSFRRFSQGTTSGGAVVYTGRPWSV